jgi:hypothetical protein
LKYNIVASIPALKNIKEAMNAVKFIIIFKYLACLVEIIDVKKSTWIWFPSLNKGPRRGNTSQQINTGGNSINQS